VLFLYSDKVLIDVALSSIRHSLRDSTLTIETDTGTFTLTSIKHAARDEVAAALAASL